eukprot:3816014-Rhodomonas_salina.1
MEEGGKGGVVKEAERRRGGEAERERGRSRAAGIFQDDFRGGKSRKGKGEAGMSGGELNGEGGRETGCGKRRRERRREEEGQRRRR